MRGGQDAAGPPGGRDAPAAPSGTRSAAEELANKAGTTAGAAKDAMDTSTRLPGQPELDKAIRRGELSPAQAGLISSAAAANPSAERRLTELAGQVSLAELREECARVRAAADPDPEATNRRLHAGRRLRRWTDCEGFWNLHAKGSPQAGALFNTVLDPIIDRIFKTASRAGRREHPDAYAFDALIHLAEHAAGHCDCDHPNQPARGAGDNRADAAAGNGGPAGHADADWGDPTGRDATDADTTEAARADAAGADCGGTDAGADADAGFSGAASRGAATPTGERAADSAAWTDPGTAGTNRSANAGVPSGGADSDDRPGSALAVGDPGIFAAPAGATGSVGRTESGSGCAVRPSTNPRYLALLRVDAQALRRGHVPGEELCEIAGVGPVPVSVARDLLGEAILKLVITDGVDVANVTHLGRGPTAAQTDAAAVDQPHLLGPRLRPPADRIRPPETLGADPAHPPRRIGPAVRVPPRPEDPPRTTPSYPAQAKEPSSHPTTPDTPDTANPLGTDPARAAMLESRPRRDETQGAERLALLTDRQPLRGRMVEAVGSARAR